MTCAEPRILRRRILAASLGLLLLLGATGQSRADFLDIDLSGWSAFGFFGDPDNTSAVFNIGANSTITSIEYIGLEFEAFGPSWQSELVLSVNDSLISNYWDWNPGEGIDSPGTFSGSGSFGVPGVFLSGPFSVLDDGLLYVEVYELFTDGVLPDSTIRSGILRVNFTPIPEPSSVALFLAGTTLVVGRTLGRKRRRNALAPADA